MTQIFLLLLFGSGAGFTHAVEAPKLPNGEISGRSFVDQSMIVSKYTTELYAHQSSLRIVKGSGYAVYQCSEITPEEYKEASSGGSSLCQPGH